jgi:hypothetical protein
MVAALGVTAIFISVIVIVGGSLAPKHPGVAAILELITCIAGIIAILLFWIISKPLLLDGALLAFLCW